MIQTHHDGHGLTEQIEIRQDEPGPGGASHLYTFHFIHPNHGGFTEVGRLQFQKGPRNEPGSTPGLLTVAVLAALVDQLQAFQKGPVPSRETALAITKMEEAMHWLKARADERARRGALGTMQK